MKKYFLTIGVIAASILALSSCNREENYSKEPEKNKVTFTFTAEKAGEETRTAVVEGATKASYLWTTEDQANLHLYLIGEDSQGKETKTEIDNENITFNFSQDHKTLTLTAAVDEADSYTFRAILAGAFSTGHNPQIKPVQTPATDTYDPAADLLISDDLTTSSPSNLSLTFSRKAVINKMTLKNITAGEKVKSVVIASTGKNLTGTFSNNAFSNGDKTLRLNYSSQPVVAANGEFPVYFAAIPNTGHELTVTLTTDQKKYTKKFGGNIAFNQGQFTRFSVALPAGEEIDEVEGHYYIAAMPGNWMLMDCDCTDQSTGYYSGISSGATSTAAEVEGADFLSVPNFEYYFWNIEAVTGGYTIQNDHTGNYLACTSDNNYASYKDIVDETTVFSIEMNGMVATILSTEYTNRQLMYNSSGTSNRFAFYKGTQNVVYLIPTYDDGLEAATLSFPQDVVNRTTSDYDEFTGLTLSADPSSILSSVTYGMEGDAIGTVNASTGVVTLNGTTGSATVTAVFPGNATYRSTSASYTINVTTDSGSKFKIVTSLAGVTEGTYIIVNNGYYLPNAAATNAGPVKSNDTKVTIEGDYVTNVSDEMTWTFSGPTSSMTIKSTIEGDYFLVVSGNNNSNLRVNTTTNRTWTITDYSGTSGAFSLKDNTNNRFCASYSSGSDWRSYNTYNASNYGDGGRIYLYKEEESSLPDPGMSWSAASASASITDNGAVFNNPPTLTQGNASGITYNSTDEDVATISNAGVVTIVGAGETTIQAIFAGNSSYKPSTVSYTLTVTDDRTPSYDFETVAELNALVTSTSSTYSGHLSNAVVSFTPSSDTRVAIIKDASGSVMFYKTAGHGLQQGQSFTGDIEVTAVKYNNLYSEVTAWDAEFTGSQSTVAPESVTLSSLIGHYDDYQNAYVTVAGLTVESIDNKNISVTDGTNNYVVFYNPGTPGCTAGDVITATGTITKYSTTEELKVWASGDITVTSHAISYSTVAQVLSGGAGSYDIANLLVYAVNGNNAIVGDATGKMLLFMTNSLAVGDNISIESATATVYQGVLEITAGTITTNSTGNTVSHGTATNLNDATAASSTYSTFSATGYHSAVFVSMTGAQSGRNITGSHEHTTLYLNVADATYDGKTVAVTGYIYSWSSSYSNYNFQCVSIEEDTTTPTLSVDPTSLSWAASETDTKTLTVTLNGSVAAGYYSYSVTSGTASDWTITKNNGTLSVAPKATNTSTTAAKSITIRIAHSGDNSVYQDVTCTQAKAVSGTTYEYSFTISPSDFTTASYAANNGTHTSTAICTTDSSKTLTITWTSNQVYQNSSVMQWQKSNGYLFNNTDLGTIKSVTVNSTAGSFTTYYGTNEHPTSGATVGYGYFTVKTGTSATGKTSSIVVTFEK